MTNDSVAGLGIYPNTLWPLTCPVQHPFAIIQPR